MSINIFSDKKKLLGILGILIIIAAVPLTVLIGQKQQEIRQRASGEETSLYFTEAGSTVQLEELVLSSQKEIKLDLYLDTPINNVSGFDITIQAAGGRIQLQPGRDADKFNFPVLNKSDSQESSYRFSKFNANTGNIINGKLHLAAISFTATEAEGFIEVANATITSPVSEKPSLSVAKPKLTYKMRGLTSIPTQASEAAIPSPTSEPTVTRTPNLIPSLTLSKKCVANEGDSCGFNDDGIIQCNGTCKFEIPTPTSKPTSIATSIPTITLSIPTPTLTLVSCERKFQGDANCDDKINLIDFNIWRDEANGILPTKTANFNSNEDDSVNRDDYDIWKESYENESVPH